MTPRARLALALLFCLLAATALAAPRDPSQYPLRVHIFSRHVHHSYRFGSFSGMGKANLIADQTIAGVEFSYDCLYKFPDSEEDEYYPARWKHEGLSLDILMGVMGSDTATHTCELKIARKDYAYQRINGKVRTISLQDYAALDMARAERNESLSPRNTDPNAYPLNLSLLRIHWNATVSGLHTGTGQGNLRTPDGLTAVDFSLHCPVEIQPTPEGRYLLGRWLAPGTQMLLLLRPIDVDGASGATCDVTTVVDPDVYVRSGNSVKAISQQEYRARHVAPDGPGEQ